MNTQALADLKECPLCGGSVTVKAEGRVRTLICEPGSRCNKSGLVFMYMVEHEAAAITAWNTRQAASGGVVISAQFAAFLNGEYELEGVSFGQLPDGVRARYWWRKYLAAPALPAAGCGDTTQENDQ